MTATLTGNFIYTDAHNVEGSGVIDSLYYNEEQERLVVEGLSGFLAGYEGVPKDVYLALVNEAKAATGSVGHYWNTWIKPLFKGFDTGWINDLVPADDDDEAFSFTNVTGPEEVAVPEAELQQWVVTALTEGSELDLYIKASNLADLGSKFDQIALIAGWDNAVLTSAAQV